MTSAENIFRKFITKNIFIIFDRFGDVIPGLVIRMSELCDEYSTQSALDSIAFKVPDSIVDWKGLGATSRKGRIEFNRVCEK